jgi:hypothetical protein
VSTKQRVAEIKQYDKDHPARLSPMAKELFEYIDKLEAENKHLREQVELAREALSDG